MMQDSARQLLVEMYGIEQINYSPKISRVLSDPHKIRVQPTHPAFSTVQNQIGILDDLG